MSKEQFVHKNLTIKQLIFIHGLPLSLPVVPIILGMVLGGIAEAKFRTSMARVDTPIEFINRPIAAILFGLILPAVFTHCYTVYKE